MATPTPIQDSIDAFRRKQRKVRQSCNACSSQKIRCGKQRPKCTRCAIKGLCCEYGMSMRTGERPRAVASPVGQRDAGNTTPVSPGDAPRSTVENAFSLTQMNSASDHSAGTDMDELQDDIDWVLQATVGTPEFGLSNEHHGSMNQSYGLLPTPCTQEYSFSNFNHDHGLDLQSRDKQHPAGDHSDSAASQRSPSIDCDAFRPSMVHDCTTEALMLVADFHVLATGCLTAAKDPVSPFALGCYPDDAPREMGTVLSENRRALRRLDNLLDCRCSARQEILVLIYLAIAKVVEWYAAVLGSDAAGAEDDDDDEASRRDDDAAAPRMFRRIARSSSFIGSYSLDSDAQRLVSAHLVLTQLKDHVHPLLKRMRHRHPSAAAAAAAAADSSSDSASSGRGAPGVIEHHHIALSEKLDRISAKANSIKQIC
ncbi:Aflatoxin biosynthesis regulatory protein [Colletotrichum spinosum]|uniref:Aflatoxin biosynthesis regulatory protein n=1 Tax=Colletotrichum spinosum TaxID=1347390 RepID=A0A4R8PTA5_9PEZI|nr:Aflatoxin biosynthesis regulatory protein [Colletotrichum spinosum]